MVAAVWADRSFEIVGSVQAIVSVNSQSWSQPQLQGDKNFERPARRGIRCGVRSIIRLNSRSKFGRKKPFGLCSILDCQLYKEGGNGRCVTDFLENFQSCCHF